jgi:hypothetical protein
MLASAGARIRLARPDFDAPEPMLAGVLRDLLPNPMPALDAYGRRNAIDVCPAHRDEAVEVQPLNLRRSNGSITNVAPDRIRGAHPGRISMRARGAAIRPACR